MPYLTVIAGVNAVSLEHTWPAAATRFPHPAPASLCLPLRPFEHVWQGPIIVRGLASEGFPCQSPAMLLR
ncbi:hypothetical protein E2C01_041143 [Portunus trituberculatus]|uniref:Uncharacterized protein n=1 Tax=Portunus trituberculatus TaxID=210409 RepID=A0A5B7FR40_PORTR|nr:hypothetical protein [Portunus trituberculatus]